MALLALVDVHLGADDDGHACGDGGGTAIQAGRQHEGVDNLWAQPPKLPDDRPPRERTAPARYDAEWNHLNSMRRDLGTNRTRWILEAAHDRLISIARQSRDHVEDQFL